MLQHKKNCASVKEYCSDCVHFGRGYCMVAVGKKPEEYDDEYILNNCKEQESK